MNFHTIGLLCMMAVPWVGCTISDEASYDGVAPAPTATAADPGPDAPWYPCPSRPGIFAECVKLNVPLDWDDPTGPAINYFIKRSLAKTQPARGQVWILQGGPGGSGGSIEHLAPLFREMAEDLDIYIPDHRGTGYSEYLDCPSFNDIRGHADTQLPAIEAAAKSCVASLKATYGEGLAHFTAADAARDLGELAARVRGPDQQLYIYGVSYGTRWLHRYLQQFPDQATGVIFDSSEDENETSWWTYNDNVNAGAKRIFDDCSADTFCQSKMGPDAWAMAQQTMARLDTEEGCPTEAGWTKLDYLALLSTIVRMSYTARAEVVPLMYRLNRCDSTDQEVLTSVFDAVFWSSPWSYHARGLYYNVAASELLPTPAPTDADILAGDEALTILGQSVRVLRVIQGVWPLYDPSPWLGAYASTSTPVLILQGTYDIQTPLGPAEAFASHFQGANQTFVPIDRGSHGVIHNSPVIGTDTDCGTIVAQQFLADPTSELTTSCATETPPLDFAFDGKDYGEGTVDLWENDTTRDARDRKGVNELGRLRQEASRILGGRL